MATCLLFEWSHASFVLEYQFAVEWLDPVAGVCFPFEKLSNLFQIDHPTGQPHKCHVSELHTFVCMVALGMGAACSYKPL